MHCNIAYIFIPVLFLCLENEPLESDPSAAVGGISEFETIEEATPTEGKHLYMLSYYFYTLDESKLAICVVYCIVGL